jgi:hypothetical protein
VFFCRSNLLVAICQPLYPAVIASRACSYEIKYEDWYGGLKIRIFHELLSRDNEEGCATWQPQGVGSEAYLNGTSQGPTLEDARKDDHIRGRSK